MKTRHFVWILLFITLCGCYTNKFTSQTLPKKPTERVYPIALDSAWTAVMKVMAAYPLTVIEKQSGILNTDWTTRTVLRKVSVWRGLIYGGQVQDECPVEVMERYNVLVSAESDTTTRVKFIRYAKTRSYRMLAGAKGSWAPNEMGDFVQTESSTYPEFAHLEAIDQCLKTGVAPEINPDQLWREEQEKLGADQTNGTQSR